MGLSRPRTFRDVALIFLGAAAMHFTSSFLGPFSEHSSSAIVNTHVSSSLCMRVQVVVLQAEQEGMRDALCGREKPRAVAGAMEVRAGGIRHTPDFDASREVRSNVVQRLGMLVA